MHFLAFPLLLACIIIQPCTTVIWKMDTSFNNRRMGKTSRAIIVFIIESPSECAMKCSENDACASFFHNCHLFFCELHAVPYRSTLNTLESKENRYFLPVSATCPLESGYVLDRFSNLCLKFIFGRIGAYDNYKSSCDEMDGTLVSLDSEIKHSAFSKIYLSTPEVKNDKSSKTPGYFLLGARRIGSTKEFQWVSRHTVAMSGPLSKWSPGEPSNMDENCMSFDVQKGTDYFGIFCNDRIMGTACEYKFHTP